MKAIIVTGLLLICGCMNSYGQDTSKIKDSKSKPYVQHFGPYTVTMEDNKVISVVKDPNYDKSKIIYRDTSTRFKGKSTVQIYIANSQKPIIKRYLICDLNSIASDYIMPRQERLAKYHSRDAVDIIHLKKGVELLSTEDLLRKFGVAKSDTELPVYISYRHVADPDEILAVPNAVLSINVIRDGDGFRFLNIATKAWDAERKKYAGQTMIWLR